MATSPCSVCGAAFTGRCDALYCSSACRQKAHRARTARRTAMLRERVSHVSAPVISRSDAFREIRRSVQNSLERARAHVDRSRDLCRTSTERLEQSAVIQQQLWSRVTDAPWVARRQGAPWPGN